MRGTLRPRESDRGMHVTPNETDKVKKKRFDAKILFYFTYTV